MTRAQIKERALARLVEQAQDRNIRLENARIERMEAHLLAEYFAGLDGLLTSASRKEESKS